MVWIRINWTSCDAIAPLARLRALCFSATKQKRLCEIVHSPQFVFLCPCCCRNLGFEMIYVWLEAKNDAVTHGKSTFFVVFGELQP